MNIKALDFLTVFPQCVWPEKLKAIGTTNFHQLLCFLEKLQQLFQGRKLKKEASEDNLLNFSRGSSKQNHQNSKSKIEKKTLFLMILIYKCNHDTHIKRGMKRLKHQKTKINKTNIWIFRPFLMVDQISCSNAGSVLLNLYSRFVFREKMPFWWAHLH